jgi:hypothetical protein
MASNDAYQRSLTATIDQLEGARPALLCMKKEIQLCMKNEIQLRIGNVSCTLRCQDADDAKKLMKLKRLYHNFLTRPPADVTIELTGTDRLSPEDLNAALHDNKFVHEANIFRSTNDVVDGQYDLTV